MMRSALLIVALALGAAACNPGLGERCNPLLFNDACQDNTKCVYPDNCGVAYCCPMGPNDVPSCQACPAPDGGSGD
jgi:hypothetical protein